MTQTLTWFSMLLLPLRTSDSLKKDLYLRVVYLSQRDISLIYLSQKLLTHPLFISKVVYGFNGISQNFSDKWIARPSMENRTLTQLFHFPKIESLPTTMPSFAFYMTQSRIHNGQNFKIGRTLSCSRSAAIHHTPSTW